MSGGTARTTSAWGTRLRWFRETHRRETREEFAAAIGCDARLLARWERGEVQSPRPSYRRRLAELDAPLPVEGAAGTHELKSPSYRSEGSDFAGVPVADDGGGDAAAMQAFRAADLRVGGGNLYESVVGYLRGGIAPRLFDVGDNVENSHVITAASALTEMAGWMAHDAGRDELAERHFGRSLALVRVGGDHQLYAHVRGSMSHLASHRNLPTEAIRRAREGRDILRPGPRNPDLEARLLAMEARGHASLNRAAECGELLRRAEKALEQPRDEPASLWTSDFDEGSLASETARCLRQLGDLTEARLQAERVITLRPSHRIRSRAFGQLTLARVLVAQRRPEEACALVGEVVGATRSLGSVLIVRQLDDMRRLLEPHSASESVAELLLLLEETLRDRFWLHQWIAPGERDSQKRRGETL